MESGERSAKCTNPVCFTPPVDHLLTAEENWFKSYCLLLVGSTTVDVFGYQQSPFFRRLLPEYGGPVSPSVSELVDIFSPTVNHSISLPVDLFVCSHVPPFRNTDRIE